MYLTPLIFTSFHPLYYPPPHKTIHLSYPTPPSCQFYHKNTLNNCLQKFQKTFSTTPPTLHVPLSINYMKLSPKYQSLRLIPLQQFILLYHTVVNKYKHTYQNDTTINKNRSQHKIIKQQQQQNLEKKERNRIKLSWGKNDIMILLWITNWLVHEYQVYPEKWSKCQWGEVASYIPFRSGSDCMYRWLLIRKNELDEYPWTPEEKQQLTNIIQPSNPSPKDWTTIAESLHEKIHYTDNKYKNNYFRTPKQCKQQWNFIQSQKFQRSKKLWSYEEDMLLIDSFRQFGRRWKEIAKVIKGRSENGIKNRFGLLGLKYCGREIVSKNQRGEIMEVKEGIIRDSKGYE